ncbi:exported hypothetical protein [Frankia sp. Hr75.2]|nr:exported hypothetical protein [Frankia sp. Hr75.2]
MVSSGFLTLAIIALAALAPAIPASAQVTAVNPVLTASPGNLNADPGHGCLVLAEGDSGLFSNETEGPVAIGGNVQFQNCRVGLNNPGTYTLPGGGAPARAGAARPRRRPTRRSTSRRPVARGVRGVPAGPRTGRPPAAGLPGR